MLDSTVVKILVIEVFSSILYVSRPFPPKPIFTRAFLGDYSDSS
jgi:hypothetical protein